MARDVKILTDVSAYKLKVAVKDSIMCTVNELERDEVHEQYDKAFEKLFELFVREHKDLSDEDFLRNHRLFTFLVPSVVEELYDVSKQSTPLANVRGYFRRFEKLKYRYS